MSNHPDAQQLPPATGPEVEMPAADTPQPAPEQAPAAPAPAQPAPPPVPQTPEEKMRALLLAVAALGANADTAYSNQLGVGKALESITQRVNELSLSSGGGSARVREPRLFNGRPAEVRPFIRDIWEISL